MKVKECIIENNMYKISLNNLSRIPAMCYHSERYGSAINYWIFWIVSSNIFCMLFSVQFCRLERWRLLQRDCSSGGVVLSCCRHHCDTRGTAAETTRWKQFVLSSLLLVLSFQRMPTESSPTIYC